jgi:glutaredoxin
MTAVLYGKQGCGKCGSAEEKLKLLRVPYRKIDMENPPEDWRTTNLPEAMAMYQLHGTLPFIEVGGTVMFYAQAMRKLKDEQASST